MKKQKTEEKQLDKTEIIHDKPPILEEKMGFTDSKKDIEEKKLEIDKETIKEHYQKVKSIIQRCAKENNFSRLGNGDFYKWYKTDSPKEGFCRLYNLQNDEDYNELTQKYRTLYWSLNFFDENIFSIHIPNNLHDETGKKLTIGNRKTTQEYSLSVDIDATPPHNVHEPETKKALEDAAQYFIDKTKPYLPNSLDSCFSGNGVYVYVHHKAVMQKKEDIDEEERDTYWYLLQGCFNRYIKDVEHEFFKEHPEHIDRVKFDALDNAKRVFKTIYSVHKKYPYAVIPLDTNNIKINLEDAKIPLKDEVIRKGEKWYITWDENPESFYRRLNVYAKDVMSTYNAEIEPGEIEISETPIPEKHFPPCIKNILKRKDITAGKTRAITILATFLGQAGWQGDEAQKLFEKKAIELGAKTTNIWESWFRRFACPGCKKIKTKAGGFPHLYMGEIGICTPDETCEEITTPIKYALCGYKGKKTENKEIHHVRVSNLNADMVNKKIKIDVQIVGENIQKSIPNTFKIECTKCGNTEKINLHNQITGKDTDILLKIIFKEFNALKNSAKYRFEKIYGDKCEGDEKHSVWHNANGNMDFSVLYVRDLPNESEKFDQRTYNQRTVYLVNQTLPVTKKVSIYGKVIVEPKTRDISILADKIEPYEDAIINFVITEEDKKNWHEYFNNDNKENNIKIENEINPDIIKRDIAKKVIVRVLHSPAIIPDVNNNPIRGGIRALLFGDTKTSKSQLTKYLVGEIPSGFTFGEYVVADTSSRTGIIYSIDPDKKALIWGALPRNDLGLVVIDSLQSLYAEEMREFREMLENQKISVHRSVSGEALARTRIIGCFNPGKPETKPMNQYIYPVMGIKDTFIFAQPPDITRWDIFVSFKEEDVTYEEIAERGEGNMPIPKDVFYRHVFWVWSRKHDQVYYTEEAKEEIKKEAAEIMDTFCIESLPIVHSGFRDILTRFSVSEAALHHSTDETHEKIIVEKKHVEQAAEEYIKVLDLLQLEEYKMEEEGMIKNIENNFESINAGLDNKYYYDILKEIKINPTSSSVLAQELDVSEKTVKNYYKKLKGYGLIKTSPHKGIELTPAGIKFITLLIQKNGEIGKKNFPNAGIGEEKLPYYTKLYLWSCDYLRNKKDSLILKTRYEKDAFYLFSNIDPAKIKETYNTIINKEDVLLRVLQDVPEVIDPNDKNKTVYYVKGDILTAQLLVAERLVKEGYGEIIDKKKEGKL